MSDDDRIVLTTEQALGMLPDDDDIHTFRNPGGIMLGCDWTRDAITQAIENNECELGGEMCKRMNHGLVIWVDSKPLFVECRDEIDYKAFEAANVAK